MVAALAVLIALVVAHQVVTLGAPNVFDSTFNNALHVPLFATLTLLLARLLRWPQWWRLLLAALALSAATEALQLLTARSASLQDLGVNLLGIVPVVAGLEAHRWLRRHRARPLTVAAMWLAILTLLTALTLAAPLRVLLAYEQRDRAFPLLLLPEAWERSPLMESSSSARLVPAPASWPDFAGERVLEIVFADESYPGILVRDPVADWSAFDTLVVDVWLPQGPPLPLTAAVGYIDRDRSSHLWRMVPPGPHRLRYPLSELLAADESAPRISRLVLNTSRPHAGRRLLIGRVALEVAAPAAP